MNKYRSIPTVVDNIKFASKREAARYSELKLLERAGVIKDLKLQVPFVFSYDEVKICTYISDFTYIEGNRQIVEDVKGTPTPVYLIKKKLMLAFYSITIRET